MHVIIFFLQNRRQHNSAYKNWTAGPQGAQAKSTKKKGTQPIDQDELQLLREGV